MKYKTILMREGIDKNGTMWTEQMLDMVANHYSDKVSIPITDGFDGMPIGKVISVFKQKDEFGNYIEGICEVRKEVEFPIVGMVSLNVQLLQAAPVLEPSFDHPKLEKL